MYLHLQTVLLVLLNSLSVQSKTVQVDPIPESFNDLIVSASKESDGFTLTNWCSLGSGYTQERPYPLETGKFAWFGHYTNGGLGYDNT